MRTELDPLGADVGYTSPYAYNMTYSDIMGSDNLYDIRGNALDIRGGCTLDGMSISCSEAMQAVQSGTAEQVVLVAHYVTARANGQTVFRGYVGTGFVRAADMWRSEITTPGTFTPQQVQQYGSQFGNQSFWARMLNGSINFNTSYADTTYSDDVGTHDISTPYNVNIYGGAAFIGQNPQESLGCITGRWLLNNPAIQSSFNEVWQQTAKSGKENGGWMFYEPKTNTIHIDFASEGTDSSMPNETTDFANQTRKYQQEGRSVLFIGMFHTHPNGSQYPSSVFGDMDVLSGRNNVRTKGGAPPIGFIIYGSGKYTPYDENGVLFDVNSRTNGVDTNRMTRCL